MDNLTVKIIIFFFCFVISGILLESYLSYYKENQKKIISIERHIHYIQFLNDGTSVTKTVDFQKVKDR